MPCRDGKKIYLNCKGAQNAISAIDRIRKSLTEAMDKGGIVLVAAPNGLEITTYRLNSYRRRGRKEMIKKSEMNLWLLVQMPSASEIEPGEFVSILSQLCVLNRLRQRDDEFRTISRGGTDSKQVLVGELLEAGLASLAREGTRNPFELINTDSTGWSQLPSSWINQMLEALEEFEMSPEQTGRWLLAHARSRLGRKLDFPREFLALIRELARKSESIYLPFDAPALSLFELTSRKQEVTLRPQSDAGIQAYQTGAFSLPGDRGRLRIRIPIQRLGSQTHHLP